MREIKFRCWHKELKKMFDFDELCNMVLSDFGQYESRGMPSPLSILNPKMDTESLIADDKDTKFSLDTCNFMQYIGLKDKNGEEVYQEDILKITANKENYGETSYEGRAIIVGETCNYAFCCFKPSLRDLQERGEGWDSTSLWHLKDVNGKYIEVIGNVYENPELLIKPKGK